MALALRIACVNRLGYPKERFTSERAARRAVARKWSFHSRRYPRIYACPDCHGFHMTSVTS